MKVGDFVKILPPFDVHYPERYEIIEIKGDVITVLLNGNNTDFHVMYLELWQ